MDAIELVSCIRFKPRKFAKDYLQIFSGKYCKSHLGRTGGAQPLSLNWRGIIIHELLHALGYIHMHNRPDRDKYVKIMWKNIAPQWFGEFDKVNPSNFNHLGTPYDYQSIMHYGSTAFTKNGKITILTRNGEHIGQRFGLSQGDIRRINNKYNCNVGSSRVNYFPSPFYGGTKSKKLFAKRHPITRYVEDDATEEEEDQFEDEDDDYLFDS
ncbi:hypothetical protein HA402_009454 [Bradysia odoriphaga]|nr:hypothetical protein HA402_009454 [Bradysia odoriphaga]